MLDFRERKRIRFRMHEQNFELEPIEDEFGPILDVPTTIDNPFMRRLN